MKLESYSEGPKSEATKLEQTKLEGPGSQIVRPELDTKVHDEISETHSK